MADLYSELLGIPDLSNVRIVFQQSGLNFPAISYYYECRTCYVTMRLFGSGDVYRCLECEYEVSKIHMEEFSKETARVAAKELGVSKWRRLLGWLKRLVGR